MNLTTPRLRLRPFTAADISPSYLGWLNDPGVNRFSNQRFQRHTAESCAAYLNSYAGSANSFVLIERLEDQQPIGTATVYRNIHHGTADIGLMVGDRRCWGQGYGFEAWQGIVALLLDEPGIRKVTGGTARVNLAMIRIMERSGMKLEAVRRKHEIIAGQEVDILYYSLFSSSLPRPN